MERYVVCLTPEERADLQRLVTTGKSAARRLMHARILLLADREDRSDEQIISSVGASRRTVERVRKRLVTEGLEAAIDHRPQPPRPDKIKIRGDVEQKLIQLACSDPPRGRCYWTLQLLADEMVVLGLAENLSTETVRQALKKTTAHDRARPPVIPDSAAPGRPAGAGDVLWIAPSASACAGRSLAVDTAALGPPDTAATPPC